MPAITTDLQPSMEPCTGAVESLHPDTSDRLVGPVLFGFYPDADFPEIWLEQEGKRVQFFADALPAVIKQLKRAALAAKETT